ncbi:MAG: DNA-packaging protein [Acidobacteria bacterium]|nr:DNA-packaging protein [Acidobacteriota bacterium]
MNFLGRISESRPRTAWNADTLRGDYADLLILDEWQLMAEETWEEVGSPMLLDNNGNAVFIYTPPSLHFRSVSKARDPRHASKMFAKAVEEMKRSAATGELSNKWEAFHFTSRDNPHISPQALDEVSRDMTSLAYRQEILAEDLEDNPGALWTRTLIERGRVEQVPELSRVRVGVDPPGGQTECGIIVAGIGRCSCRGKEELHAFAIADRSLKGSPDSWAKAVVAAYHSYNADRVYGETNFGGDMVKSILRTADPRVAARRTHIRALRAG